MRFSNPSLAALAAVLPILTWSCQAVETAPSHIATEQEQAPISLTDWGKEHIPFPPEFAPGLPAGDEVLLFAPGMFAEGEDDFWSYAFLIELETGPMDREALDEFLEEYYDGLVQTVAEGREVPIEGEPADVTLKELAKGAYAANVELIDPFVTGKPLALNMQITVQGNGNEQFIRAMVSPQPAEHHVWNSLRAAVASLAIPTGSDPKKADG